MLRIVQLALDSLGKQDVLCSYLAEARWESVLRPSLPLTPKVPWLFQRSRHKNERRSAISHRPRCEQHGNFAVASCDPGSWRDDSCPDGCCCPLDNGFPFGKTQAPLLSISWRRDDLLYGFSLNCQDALRWLGCLLRGGDPAQQRESTSEWRWPADETSARRPDDW